MTTLSAPSPIPTKTKASPAPTPRRAITWEHIAYVALFVAALLLHVWALGDRALHHDETHHSNFPWILYTGQGYVHDPLLHGPFLYFLNALFFGIFGDSDFTTRFSAAVFGTALTVLPALLRREMGRGTALLASAYLLISPVALYVGRFIRHDIFAVTFEVLCIVGVIRYVATRRAGYLYMVSAAFALMVTTMESSYLFLLIVGSFLFLIVIWHINWKLIGLPLLYVAVVVVANLTLSAPHVDGDPTKPVMPLVTDNDALLIRHQPNDNWREYFTNLDRVLFGHETSQTSGEKGFNGLFLHQWVTVAVIGAGLLLLSLIWLIFLRRDREGCSAWRRAVDDAQPDTLLPALDTLRGWRVVLALALYFFIYTLLFTSFFFNRIGVVTGTTGSFLYWLGQHYVERGGQPKHYYLVLHAIYEPLLVIFGGTGIIAGLGYGLRRLIRDGGLTARTMTPPLLAWWALCALLVYSWAGEKMPWLMLHMVVPLSLIGAWCAARALPLLLGTLRGQARRGLTTFIAAIVILGVYITVWMNAIVRSDNQQIVNASPTSLLQGALIGMTIVTAYVVWQVLYLRKRALPALGGTLGGLLLGVSILLGTYTLRSSVRLNYQNGDVPVEMMVYVQSSPNVLRAIRQLEQASILQTGRMEMAIIYDGETIWKWYLRNFPNKELVNGALTERPGPEVGAVLLEGPHIAGSEQYLREFVKLRQPMRWHFPEQETYRLSVLSKDQSQLTRLDNATCPRGSLLDRVLCAPGEAATINELWRYLMFREPPTGLGGVDFAIFVRPEIAHLFDLSPVPPRTNTITTGQR